MLDVILKDSKYGKKLKLKIWDYVKKRLWVDQDRIRKSKIIYNKIVFCFEITFFW